MPHVSKKLLARNENLFQTKNRPRMNYEWIGKTIQKNSDRKIKKNSKSQSDIATCEQKKTTSEEANFCSNTVFSLYFKIEANNFTPQNHSLFRSTSCFGVTKITTPN